MNKLKTYKIIGGLLIAYSVFSIGLATYALYLLKGIETFYRIMVSLLLVLFLITLIYSVINSIKFFKKKKFIISCILTTLLSIVGIGISIWIFYTGIVIFLESFNVLMDKALGEDDINKILEIKENFTYEDRLQYSIGDKKLRALAQKECDCVGDDRK